jgi:hypothetical protein
MDFSLFYKKNKNENLFRELEDYLEVSDIQNYYPLYKNFFSLNETNYNVISLNHKYHLESFTSKESRNVLSGIIKSESDELKNTNIFCKFSPLLDPLKTLTGKYNDIDFILPSLNNDELCIPKLIDTNNNSYVDTFFTYLSSQLYNHHNFPHGIDMYGSYLAIQNNFVYNISDDVEYLNDSDYFHDNINKKFFVDNKEFESIFHLDSRRNKRKLIINNNDSDNDKEQITVNDISDINTDLLLGIDSNDIKIVDLSNVCIYNTIIKKNKSDDDSDNSSCSSKSSNTNEYSDNEISSEICSEESSESLSSCEEEAEEAFFCKIDKFPIQIICMEKCENTLDYLMENNIMKNDEWISSLFQIIITLSIYQKVFSFTHNDLHTNNIMYTPTDKQFLIYKYNNIHYKVPTYGRIFKIIDFGRSIYKYDSKLLCSDSFHSKGDAASQYNCEPYFDSNKPRLEPNRSFDLSRLACCIYDYFIEDIDDAPNIIRKNKIASLINDWLIDDKGRNILYKKDGEERYPEFKLYKMIARTIHNAIPEKQLDHEIFKKFIISKKKLNIKSKIYNFDNIPNLQ